MRGTQPDGHATPVSCGPLPRPPRHPPTVPRRHHRHRKQPRPPAPPTRTTPPPHHQHTTGRTGSLTRLIRQPATTTAIRDGAERLTRTTPEAIRLNHLTETHHHPRTQTANPTQHTAEAALTSTNTNRAMTRQNYPQQTLPTSTQNT